MKCQTCIWADWRSGTKVFCPFPACVKKEPERESIKVENQEEKTGMYQSGKGGLSYE